MKNLTLIRHAKSSWDNANLSDFERPLNPRGLRDAPLISSKLVERIPALEYIISSPAERAITTAHFFAQAAQLEENAIVQQPSIYGADESTLLSIVQSLDNQLTHVALVGHNPTMTEFLNLLAGYTTDNLPTCSVACLTFAIKEWSEVSENNGKLEALMTPKQYKN